MRFIIIAAIAALSACTNKTDSANEVNKTKHGADVVYGQDDRRDLYEVRNPVLLDLADSTVAVLYRSSVSPIGQGKMKLRLENYGKSNELCPAERFADQDTAAFCSGFLVEQDTIVTAGHCITGPSQCSSTSFVFGFAIKNQGDRVGEAAADDVYHCASVVHTQQISAGADYAVIKLDRPVTNHKPLKLRTAGAAAVGDRLVVIGHPSGLPTKVADGASVRSIKQGFFVANLDTYGGNSGSAVFSLATGEVEGILVRGETDFQRQGSCYISKVCADSGCRGEDVTLISNVLPFLSPVPVPPPADVSVFETESDLEIPDNSPIGIASSLFVSTVPAGRKVAVTVNLKHTYRGDLRVSVIAPDGREVVIHNRSGGALDDLIGTFDVSSLGNVSISGDWKLKILDLAKIDNGKLLSWKLEFKN